ncbi:MAG: anthranilate synthase component I [bacterium]|nr:anthranilate synthase component I [bacterium]
MTTSAVRARPRRAVVHVRHFLADTLTPLAVYRRLEQISPVRFLLESAGGEQSRFSFLGAKPREIYRVYEDRVERRRSGRKKVLAGAPLQALRRVLHGIRSDASPIPLTGGFVGFFGYDMVRLIARLPERPPDPLGLPLAVLARFDAVVVFDHARHRVLVIANEIDGEVSVSAAERELGRLSRILTADRGTRAVAMPPEPSASRSPEQRGLECVGLGGAAFRGAVLKAREAIAAGEVLEAVLARRWTVRGSAEPLAIYRALRMASPSPYMVLVELPDVALVGGSPEMLVRKVGQRVEVRPIAGSRPRGIDDEGDRRLAEHLIGDHKERARHEMLVELSREELAAVGIAGTVRVSRFMEVERHSQLMHLISSVEADLATGRDGLDAVLACFPAATVAGAPKLSAVELIDELEPEARGPHAGSVGYFSFSGNVDTCTTHRTLVVRDGETSVMLWAGIGADSDPVAQERATEDEALALLNALELAKKLS